MKHFLISITASALLLACGGSPPQGPALELNGPVTQEQIDSIVATFSFEYDSPVLLDSGSHALIPMGIEQVRDRKFSLGSSSYDEEYMPRRWNVLFMDLQSLEAHLLTERKMRIDGIHTHQGEDGALLSRHVLYTLIEEDFNTDGKLDYGDPEHLSISDAAGRGLTNVSPMEEDLLGWNVIEGRDRIIIRTRMDTNGDHKFEPHEDLRVYVYDLATRQLRLVVTDELQRQVNDLFYEQWLKKQK